MSNKEIKTECCEKCFIDERDFDKESGNRCLNHNCFCHQLKTENCETPCLCDTCLKARNSELERIRKGENWRLGYQQGVKEEMEKFLGNIEKMKPARDEQMSYKLGYNQALQDIKNKL